MTTKKKHEDKFFGCMNLESAQRLRASASDLLNSPLKFTKTGKPFFWVKEENLLDVEEAYQSVLWHMSLEAIEKKCA